MVFCRKCGAENKDDAKFCRSCGAKIEINQPQKKPEQKYQKPAENLCPNCGKPLPPGAKFCRSCGTKIEINQTQKKPEQKYQKPAENLCPNCGKPLPPGAKFCRSCGTKIENTVIQNQNINPSGKQVQHAGTFQKHKTAVHPVKLKKKNKIILVSAIAICLIIALITPIILDTFLYSDDFSIENDDYMGNYSSNSNKIIRENTGKGGTGTIAPDGETVKIGDVSVNAGIFALDEEEKINVKALPSESAENGDWKIQSYDINIGDKHQLDDFITIRIPYDASMIKPGENEEECVSALWFNEESESWEAIDAEVDTDAKEVIIYTDHLSVFGSGVIYDAGKRQAYFRMIGMSLPRSQMSPMVLDQNQAAAVLEDFVQTGGKSTPEVALQAAGAVMSEVLEINSNTVFYNDFISNPMSIAALGDPSFDNGLALKLNNSMKAVGVAASAINIASGFIKGDDDSVLGAYKDSANLIINYASEAGHLASNVGLAMTGVWVLDFTINHMNTYVHLWNMDKQEQIFQKWVDDNRTIKEWRRTMINLVAKYPSDPETLCNALVKEVENYAASFWTADLEKVYLNQIVDSGYNWYNQISIRDQKKLTQKMTENLLKQLQPVAVSVEKYYQRQMIKEFRRCINKTFNLYNKNVRMKIVEVLEDDESPKYAGCKVQFGPLNKDGMKYVRNWTGTLNRDGEASTDCTILGYLMAGSPNEVRVYRKGDSPQSDNPMLVVPFVFKERATIIPITHDLEEIGEQIDSSEENDSDRSSEEDDSDRSSEQDKEKPKSGYWKMTGRSHCSFTPEEKGDVYQGAQGEHHSVHVSTADCTETSFNFHSYIEGNFWVAGLYNHGGSYQDISVTFSEPAQTYKPGETVCVNINTSVSEGGPEHYDKAWASAYATILSVSYEDIVKHDCGGAWPGAQDLTGKDGNNVEYNREESNSLAFYGKMPEGSPGEKICIRYNAYVSSVASAQSAGSVFEYEWVEDEEPEEKPKSGYWERTGRSHCSFTPEYKKDVYQGAQGEHHSVHVSTAECTETSFNFHSYIDGNYWVGGIDNYGGCYQDISVTFSEPAQTYKPGETVYVDINTSVSEGGPEYHFKAWATAYATILSVSYEDIVKHDCGGAWPGAQDLTDKDGNDVEYNREESNSLAFYGKMPEGSPGEKICIRYNASVSSIPSSQSAGSVFEYEWVE